MTGMWMRGAAVAALGWAMLAGAAQATIVTYNFSAPITSYSDYDGNAGAGTFSGSVSIDTAKLAQNGQYTDHDPDYGYIHTVSTNPAFDVVGTTWAVSGTPADALANAPFAQAPTSRINEFIQGTGSYFTTYGGGSYFAVGLTENFFAEVFGGDGTVANSYEERIFTVEFFGAATSVVDGYVLPTPGTGTVNAYLRRSRNSYVYTSDYSTFLSRTDEAVDLSTLGAQTNAGGGPDPVPEPGMLALLGLGVIGLAVRRRRAA